MYAIIDIETTGLNPHNEKITEIALLVYDGYNVTDELITLINPEKKIPYRITQLTGINNQMTEGAPRFYEVARTIIELTKDKILVGHNVSFDYGFLKAEFAAFGYHFDRETLCTCRLSRKLIPFQSSYGLGTLCKNLNIENSARHRAAGDAFATLKLFELLRTINPKPESLAKRQNLQSALPAFVGDVPHKTGVYYLLDTSGEIIYVGKSNDIHDRILQHLNNTTTRKAIEMQGKIASVNWEITGSELIALLLESEEIKRLKPLYNRSQRRSIFNFALFDYIDEKGYLCLKIDKNLSNVTPITTYSSQKEARAQLTEFVNAHELCYRLSGLYPGKAACFHYHINACRGACIGKETAEDYNLRVQKALEAYEFEHQNFFILDTGREKGENGVIKVENGKYIGFGFIQSDYISGGIEELSSIIKRYNDNRDVQSLLKSYMRRHKSYKVIPF